MLTIVNNARAGDELIRCKHLYADVDKNEVWQLMTNNTHASHKVKKQNNTGNNQNFIKRLYIV